MGDDDFHFKSLPSIRTREFLPPRTMIFRVFFQSYNSWHFKHKFLGNIHILGFLKVQKEQSCNKPFNTLKETHIVC